MSGAAGTAAVANLDVTLSHCDALLLERLPTYAAVINKDDMSAAALTRGSAGTDRAAGPASARGGGGGGAHVEEQRRGPEQLTSRRDSHSAAPPPP